MTPGRVRAARALAIVADFVQIVAMPVFSEGVLSPANDVLDVGIALAMTWLLGWHWAFLPGFLAELVPVWGLVPNWTAAVFLATRQQHTAPPIRDVN
jgi:hypothetical protein